MAGPVRAGTVFGETFRMFGDHAGTFLTLSLIVFSPMLLAQGVIVFQTDAEVAEGFHAVALFLFKPLAVAALIHVVFQLQRQRDVSVRESLRVSLSHSWRVILLFLIVNVVILVGSIFCWIPGIIAAAGLFVAFPVLLAEKTGVRAAYLRSWKLTEGYKDATFGVIFVLWLLTLAAQTLGGWVLAVAFADGPVLEAWEGNRFRSDDWPISGTLVQYLVLIPVTVLQAIAATMAYQQLRRHKEGPPEAEILDVFD